MYPYWLIFAILLVICVAVVGFTKFRAQGNDGFMRLFGADPEAVFQRKYLIVYFLVVSGDWLQGPYVYALYQKYGFSNEEIAQLFVAGFGASMLLGTFVGSLADAQGRKKFSLLYAFFYIVSCLTKHVGNYWVLMFGRLTGGIATSLLFSVFESWVVKENSKKGFDQTCLNVVFSLSIFLNSVSAILAGTVAQFASDTVAWTQLSGSVYYGGFTGPFDLAIVVLVVAGGLIWTSWEENYGEEGAELTSIFSVAGLQQSFGIIMSNRTILFLGLVQSCFEGSMYAFVFEWTPALTQIEGKNALVPFGLVFATFMVGCMLGSQLFGYLIKFQTVDQILRILFLISGASLGMVLLDSLFPGLKLTYFGFIAFEVCVGIYFPCMSTLKSKLVPEEHRASIYNLYRIPLNAIVLFVLLSKFTVTTTFGICVTLLFIAALLQSLLISTAERKAVVGQEC